MNSTWLRLKELMTFSAKFSTAQGILYEESPGFMMAQSFGGGQP
jgi:hypothetical protein